MVPPTEPETRPRVMAYVNKRLDVLRPTYRRDLINDRDVMVISLFAGDEPMHLMNVYSDADHRAIRLLDRRADSLPTMDYMAGDLNCHSREWDDAVPNHGDTAILLLETAARLGVEYSPPVNPGPMYVSHADANIKSVIDMVFVQPAYVLSAAPLRDQDLKGTSDRYPLSSVIKLSNYAERIKGRTLKEDAVALFFMQVEKEMPGLSDLYDLNTAEGVEELSVAIEKVFSDAWFAHSEEYIITLTLKSGGLMNVRRRMTSGKRTTLLKPVVHFSAL